MSGMLGAPAFDDQALTEKLQQTKAVIDEVIRQFKDPVWCPFEHLCQHLFNQRGLSLTPTARAEVSCMP
jgi:hypothetical protein